MRKLIGIGVILGIVLSGCGQRKNEETIQKMQKAAPIEESRSEEVDLPMEESISEAEAVPTEGAEEFIIENGVLEEYNGHGSTVTIPDTVTTIKFGVFHNNKDINKIIIPSSVTEIGSGAFDGCINLLEITIPKSVTTIGQNVFNGIPWLEAQMKLNDFVIVGDGILIGYAGDNTDATIPDNVKKIVDYTFRGCTNLETVTMPNGVISIGTEAFFDCINLKEITIPNTVKFFGTGALDNTKWLTDNKSEMIIVGDGILYKYKGNNKEVMIPSSVKSIATNAFYDNETITTVIGGENITDIGSDAFNGCESLESFPFSNQLETIGFQAFQYSNLKTVNLPKTIKYIDYRAFHLNEQLQSVIIDKSAQIEFIGSKAFAICGNLKQVILPDSLTSIENEAFLGCHKLSEIELPESLTCITYSSFAGCANLNKIMIPSSVTTIEDSAFEGATKLEEIIYNGKLVALGSYAFKDTMWMENITDDFVTFQNFLLTYKGNDTSITIPDNVRYICDSAFDHNETIQEVIVPDTVVSIGNATFAGSSKLKTVNLPTNLTSIGYWVFFHCSNLENITIPASVKSIGSSAFEFCGLSAITIPGNVEVIEEYAFANCTNLESVIIEEGVLEIPSEAFRNDDDYEYYAKANITIPDSVKTIGEHAFNDCDAFAAPVITCKKDSVAYQEAMRLGLKVQHP